MFNMNKNMITNACIYERNAVTSEAVNSRVKVLY